MTDSTTTTSGLDLLAAALDQAVPAPAVIIAVKARPGWAVRYRVDITQAELAEWRKRATVDGEIDGPLLNRLILANTCTAFLHQDDSGQWSDVLGDSGQPITFGTTMKQLNVTTVTEAVKAWLVTDGAVAGTSDRVYLEAGFAGLPDLIADPTRG